MDIGRKLLDITKKGGRRGGEPIRGVVLASSLVVGGAWLGSNTSGGIPATNRPAPPLSGGTLITDGENTGSIPGDLARMRVALGLFLVFLAVRGQELGTHFIILLQKPIQMNMQKDRVIF